MGTARAFHVKTGLTVDTGDITVSSGNLSINSGYIDIDNIKLDGQTISTVTGNEDINITPHGTGSVVIAKADINNGTIDGTTVGASSASTGAFTTLSATGAVTATNTVTVGVDDTGHDVKFFGATSGKYMLWDESADQMKIIGTASTVALDVDTGDFTVGAYGLTNAGAATIASMAGDWTNAGRTVADLGTITTVDINGGSIDGATIGANSAAAGTFAALTASSLSVGDGNITNVGSIAIDSLTFDNDTIQIKIVDDNAAALDIIEGTASYLKFITTNGSEAILMSKPKLTIGTGVEEDSFLIFDGAEANWRVGLDDSANKLEIGAGGTHGTTTGIAIDHLGHVTQIGQSNTGANKYLKWNNSTSRAEWDTVSGGTADSLAADDLSAGDAAVTLTTTTGNITIDAAADDSDIIFKGTDDGTDTTFLTLDGSEAGKAIFNADVTVGDDLTLLSDAAVLGFGTNTDVTLTHVHDTGLLLNGAMELQFRDSGLTIGSTSNGQLDIDADVTVDISSQVTAIAATTGISLASPSIVLSDTASSKPVVEIKNTHNGTTAGELRFVSDDGANGADGDDLGTISFYGDNDAQEQTKFAQIHGEVSDASDGAEGGKLSLGVATHDGEMQYGIILTDGSAEDEIDVTIGSGSGSVTTIAGDLTVSGTTTTVSSTTLEVTDDLITVSKGNDTIANADGSGVEIDATGATNLYWKYVHTNTAWTSNVDIDTATTSDVYKIAGTSVLTNNTLGSGVVTSSLTTVGNLNSGAITSGFSSIDVGSGAITTSGILTGGSIIGTSLNVSGTITGDTSLTLDSTTITTAEIGVLDSVTAGTVAASKALVVDSNKDIASLRNITATGTTQTGVLSVDAVAVLDTSTADNQTVADGAAHAAVTYADGTYRTAKFVYQISDGTDFESGEILVKGASAPANSDAIFMTQYATVSTKSANAALVSWDAVLNSGNIELRFTNGSGGSVDYDYRVVNTLLIK